MNTNRITDVIPHRYPFLLVDTIEDIEPGEKIVAKKNLTYNESFFQGHFPTEPVMPGVLLVEAMAQAGSVLVLSELGFSGKIAYLSEIKKARFRQKALPGDVLILEATMVKKRGQIVELQCVAKKLDKICAEATLICVVS